MVNEHKAYEQYKFVLTDTEVSTAALVYELDETQIKNYKTVSSVVCAKVINEMLNSSR